MKDKVWRIGHKKKELTDFHVKMPENFNSLKALRNPPEGFMILTSSPAYKNGRITAVNTTWRKNKNHLPTDRY